LLSHFFIKRTNEAIFFFFREQTWNHTDSQNVIDEFKESFFCHVIVTEKEGLWFAEDKFVKASQVLLEITLFVASY
jgi:hypothetical protein